MHETAAIAAATPVVVGVVAVSGWALPGTGELPCTYFSCGTADPSVAFKLAKASGKALEKGGATVVHVQRAKHMPTDAELRDVVAFVRATRIELETPPDPERGR